MIPAAPMDMTSPVSWATLASPGALTPDHHGQLARDLLQGALHDQAGFVVGEL